MKLWVSSQETTLPAGGAGADSLGKTEPLVFVGNRKTILRERQFFDQPASSVVTIVTELPQFQLFTNGNAVDFET
jgi:hypothetical protein